MERRIILHSDANCFFASCEMAFNPGLKNKAVAVCGAVEERHGIVLAKSELAKKAGIKTGMTVADAKRLCVDLCVVQPHYSLYAQYSERLKKIYARFSDCIEPFGIDECWLDVSSAIKHFDDGKLAADMIREQVYKEIGITVSVGVSFNKVFAKLGSDLKKPNATTVITPYNFKQKIYPLPAEDMLGIGPSTKRILNKYGISTIGQLANCDPFFLKKILGKSGKTLWTYANGLDESEVTPIEKFPPIKSVGHGTTPPKDLESSEEVCRLILALSQDIGTRLRQYGMRCKGVCISIRNSSLITHTHQTILERATNSSGDIARAAYSAFFADGGYKEPLRSLTVTAIRLENSSLPFQTDIFIDAAKLEKQSSLDKAIDSIRTKYGKDAVLPASICGGRYALSEAGLSLPLTRT